MKIYTKTGDMGTTSLVGGRRTSKASLRIEAYGTLDELTANMGYLASAFDVPSDICEELAEIISRVMDCSAIVASEDETLSKLPTIGEHHIEMLELGVDRLLEGLPQLTHFTLPIGSAAMSYSHVCRTVARRGERAMVRALDSGEQIPPLTIKYINRLSDYLYALGRHLSHISGKAEILWRENCSKL